MAVAEKKTSRFAFLGELLVTRGVLTPEKLRLAIDEQKRRKERLGRILIDSGFCTERDIAECLGAQLGLEVRTLTPAVVDRRAADRFDKSVMRARLFVPLRSEGSSALIAVADPFDVESVNVIESTVTGAVDLVVATASDIVKVLDQLDDGSKSVDDLLSKVDAQQAVSSPVTSQVSVEDLVNKLIAGGVRRKATDVHLEPDTNVLRVRYRIDGILTPGPMINRELSAAVVARVKVMSNLDISEQRLPQDGRARIVLEDAAYDLRISTLPTVSGENVVMRVLDGRTAALDPRALGLSPRNYDPLLEITQRPHGILLVAGPTGSGKSTTLYALLRTLNALEKKIITVEDPVEYRVPLVRQVQVNTDTGMTFAAALRSILRQDPDVILVGEIRDQETAQISVRAALTGHLVFSTIHTNTAIGAIPRLIDMGVDPFLIKSSLAGVLSQRLVRTLCNECREPVEPTPEEIAAFDPELRGRLRTLYRAKGCERCRGTGYHGRTAIHELFRMNDAVRRFDFAKTGESELGKVAEKEGFRSLFFDGQERALEGVTTLAEVMRVAVEV